ncbi:hypothetical protein THAOC_13118 [Thalassiosira oceanica]|uniref:Uncharacterized protein n=1 Tax=Thalassiosira oceanica TaxID=159749 RepID=K0SLX7_THAOC|nr:hypothetical protein THAOC_13118 [Thalassiosira oceanica]|eukprot:EJK65979.1 hypothetical protein THAOC_13118 [Thalassiosira oceanica]
MMICRRVGIVLDCEALAGETLQFSWQTFVIIQRKPQASLPFALPRLVVEECFWTEASRSSSASCPCPVVSKRADSTIRRQANSSSATLAGAQDKMHLSVGISVDDADDEVMMLAPIPMRKIKNEKPPLDHRLLACLLLFVIFDDVGWMKERLLTIFF